MLGKVTFACFLMLVVGTTVYAQNTGTSIVGFWQQNNESVYIHINEVDGVLSAEMVRNDWNPVMVGKIIWHNLETDDEKKWKGDVVVDKDGQALSVEEIKTVAITRRGTDQFSSMEKPGKRKRIKWKRSEPVKKSF